MESIIYNISNAYFPVTVYLKSGAVPGSTVIATNTHNFAGQYSFDNVLEGQYTIHVVDIYGCSKMINTPPIEGDCEIDGFIECGLTTTTLEITTTIAPTTTLIPTTTVELTTTIVTTTIETTTTFDGIINVRPTQISSTWACGLGYDCCVDESFPYLGEFDTYPNAIDYLLDAHIIDNIFTHENLEYIEITDIFTTYGADIDIIYNSSIVNIGDKLYNNGNSLFEHGNIYLSFNERTCNNIASIFMTFKFKLYGYDLTSEAYHFFNLNYNNCSECNPTTTIEPTTTADATTTSAATTTTEPTTTGLALVDVNYGYLYNWYAAMGDADGSGSSETSIAAIGWHLPAYTECDALVAYLGGMSVAGGALKETGTTHWDSPNTGATNSSGFKAVGEGYRGTNGVYSQIGVNSYILNTYSATSTTTSVFTIGGSTDTNAGSYISGDKRRSGHAVRLVKDSTTLTHGQTGIYIGNDGKIYPTICIGTQEWLATNLAETLYRNGSAITNVTDDTTWAALTTGARCSYDNDESNAINP